jgi:hypothetical protein
MIGMLPSAELTTPGPVGTVATLSPIVIVVMILIGKTVLLGLLIAMITALLDDHKRLPGVGFGISSGLGESGEESGAEPRCISDTGSASSH